MIIFVVFHIKIDIGNTRQPWWFRGFPELTDIRNIICQNKYIRQNNIIWSGPLQYD